jgi:hypothetical protein
MRGGPAHLPLSAGAVHSSDTCSATSGNGTPESRRRRKVSGGGSRGLVAQGRRLQTRAAEGLTVQSAEKFASCGHPWSERSRESQSGSVAYAVTHRSC